MQEKLVLKVPAGTAEDEAQLRLVVAKAVGRKPGAISGWKLHKKSIDARGKQVLFQLQLTVYIDEPAPSQEVPAYCPSTPRARGKKVVIIGAGPAGLFAALRLLEKGIQPVILERGKDVRARRRDLAVLNREGVVNPDSNYCFGEGGAGTYSDGKLYTRSKKRGDIQRVLQRFVAFGASENICTDAHPHIGTNKLPQIIEAMKAAILKYGGEIHFDTRVVDFIITDSKITELRCATGESFHADAYLLATGHSARDIFNLLHRKNILLEAKPFALGVRVEHPQALIDSIQYHCGSAREEFLPPAPYSLVTQVRGRGVFSFCMCPGGIIAPAATSPGELVVNGWSPSKRNNPFANSGIVVQAEKADVLNAMKGEDIPADDPLLFMKFQQVVEQRAFEAGGGNFVAPAQRLTDFVNRKLSSDLPENSYLPGLKSAELSTVLPQFVHESLADAFVAFGKKMKGYYTSEAVVVAVESRTSSPVRIPRDPETLAHPEVSNLYPCGEGAGYAGGIVSAAMDGEKIAEKIAEVIPV